MKRSFNPSGDTYQKLRVPGIILLLLLCLLPQAEAAVPAPAFSGKDLHGTTYTLEQFHGRPVVLYFWASWCPYCLRDIDNMIKTYQEFSPRGVAFISVGLDDNVGRLEKIVADHQIPYPVLNDGKVWDNPIAASYDVHGTPTFILISAEGNVIAAGTTSRELSAHLKKL